MIMPRCISRKRNAFIVFCTRFGMDSRSFIELILGIDGAMSMAHSLPSYCQGNQFIMAPRDGRLAVAIRTEVSTDGRLFAYYRSSRTAKTLPCVICRASSAETNMQMTVKSRMLLAVQFTFYLSCQVLLQHWLPISTHGGRDCAVIGTG